MTTTRAYDCPSCGAALGFQSSIAVFAVCGFCRSMVVRRDADIELLGVMAELPPDLSPLQIGTRGEWNGEGFVIIGRLRVEWEDGSWNEWCALFGGQRVGWVAEAQGFYMVSFEVADAILPPSAHAFSAGTPVELVGGHWTVVDIKHVTGLAGEGELPFAAPPGLQKTSVDLTGENGGFASIEYREEERPALYIGAYARFADLRFDNLRLVPGWSVEADPTRNQTATLGCPQCGAAVNLRAVGQTMSAVCGSCGSVIDTANPHFQVIQQADEKIRKLHPLLTIGTRGKLFDIDYEVIGFLERKDKYSRWQEYLLFNPWQGFDWLVHFQGHWSFVRRVPELGNLEESPITFEGREYSLFAQETAGVSGVLGEFYWKVRRGESARLSDYICPPRVLSKETYHQEFTWSHGEYVDRAKIAAAFGVEKLPEPTGLYLNQPNPFEEKWQEIKRPAIALLLAFFLVQALFTFRAVRTRTFEADYVFDRADPAKLVVTPRFALGGGSEPVRVAATAGVDNTWLNLDIDLVHASTNQTIPAPVAVEFYHGYSGGESWKEGGRTGTIDLAAVGAGEYFLNIEASADPTITRLPYHVRVERGGVFWSNFLLGLPLLLLYPGYLLYRRHAFERERWAESFYAPFSTSDDDE